MFDWYEDEVRGLERAMGVQAQAALRGRTVLYGSSSARMWSAFPEQFPHAAFLNVAFGGSTLEACAHYFERIVLPTQPRALIFYAGDNDIGDGHPAVKVIASFDALAAKLDRHGLGDIPFGFISIKPSVARFQALGRIRAVNDGVKRRIEERANWHYIDIFTPMLGDRGKPDKAHYVEDGLHLSAHGYALWAEVLRSHAKTFYLG